MSTATRQASAPIHPPHAAPSLIESERPLEEVLSAPVDSAELPRLVERLAELTDAGVRWWAPKLLELLDSPLGDERLRGALANVVLRAGYPWALQLDPDDVERGKDLQPRERTPSRLRPLGVAALALVVAVAFISIVQRTPRAQPPPVSLVPEQSELARATAAKVASLRTQGMPHRAQVLAEACAVVADTPIGCLRQLEDLARETANQTNDPLDRHRSGSLGRLANTPDNQTIRSAARGLFETDIGLDATYFAPSAASVRSDLLEFVLHAQTLEDVGEYKRLASEAAGCSLRHGQFGIVCRDYLDHALRHSEIITPSPLAELTPQTKDIGHLRRMIDAAREDRLDDVITEGNQCSESTTSESDACRRLLLEAHERRGRTFRADSEARRADETTAERLRSQRSKLPGE